MIKKITFVILVCCILVSCGKKGDPEYKVLNKDYKLLKKEKFGQKF